MHKPLLWGRGHRSERPVGRYVRRPTWGRAPNSCDIHRWGRLWSVLVVQSYPLMGLHREQRKIPGALPTCDWLLRGPPRWWGAEILTGSKADGDSLRKARRDHSSPTLTWRTHSRPQWVPKTVDGAEACLYRDFPATFIHKWNAFPILVGTYTQNSHNFCILRCGSRTSKNFFFFIHNFMDRRFVLSNFSLQFSPLLVWERSPFPLKGSTWQLFFFVFKLPASILLRFEIASK